MTQPSVWRLQVAQEVADAYNSTVRLAVMVAVGSVADGTADGWSDIDLFAYWLQPANMAERRRIVESMGGHIDELYVAGPEADNSLMVSAEAFYLYGDKSSGVKVDVSNYLVSGLERLLTEVIERHDMTAEKLALCHTLKRAVPLIGSSLWEKWQARIAECPLVIATRHIENNLQLFPRWSFEMLRIRRDWLYFHEILLTSCQRLIQILVGLNRLYPPLRLKHLEKLIGEMTIKPPGLGTTLQQILRGEPDAAQQLYDLVLATYDLVDKYMPQVDTSEARATLAHQRAFLEARP